MDNGTYINITDILLSGGQDFSLTNTTDLEIVTNNTAIVYEVIRRVLCKRGSWDYDRTFGSELHVLLASKSPKQISNDEVYDIVYDALSPMLQSGVLNNVNGVTITDYTRNSISIQISVTINGEVFNTTIEQTI